MEKERRNDIMLYDACDALEWLIEDFGWDAEDDGNAERFEVKKYVTEDIITSIYAIVEGRRDDIWFLWEYVDPDDMEYTIEAMEDIVKDFQSKIDGMYEDMDEDDDIEEIKEREGVFRELIGMMEKVLAEGKK